VRRIVRWAGLALAGLLGLALLGVGIAFAASEVMIRLPGPRAASAVKASQGPEAVERGRQIAVAFGCHDCHGADFRGRLFHEEPPIVTISGPNLTLAAASQTDAELDRAIRRGVAADGRSLWVMPSDALAQLSDAEAADLIAYIRTFPKGGEPMRVRNVGPVGRIGVLIGQFRSAPATLEAEPNVAPVDLGAQHARGRMLARACMECHGRDLSGSPIVKAPDLMIAGSYDAADFERLMRTGIAAGNRKVGMMTDTSLSRFKDWSAEDVRALHSYLKARAEAAT
jgi:cytochrome c553